MIFNIVCVHSQHLPYFKELIEVIKGGLQDLGHEVLFNHHYSDPGYKSIVLGGHVLDPGFINVFPKDTIILNTEPLTTEEYGRRLWNQRIKRLATHFEVWEYSPANIPILEEAGAINVKPLSLGYHKSLNRIPKLAERDIDVLFYGSNTIRRNRIFKNTPDTWKNVFMVFGDERDNLIARSKIVLNIKAQEAQSFESVRVSYLLANGVAVVSEPNPDSIDIYKGGYKESLYEDIIDTCKHLLDNPDELKALEKKALSTIKKTPQKDLLAGLL